MHFIQRQRSFAQKDLSIKMTEWFSDAYWHWRNVFYFRFNDYNDNIDRCAFFEELNYGWHKMYADDEFWGRS